MNRLVSAFILCTGLISSPLMANVTGFVNREMFAGPNLFAPPLYPSGPWTLSGTIPNVPEGTIISLWNPDIRAFDTHATYINGFWDNDLPLAVGTGARLIAPIAFTNTFVGEVRNRNFGADLDPTIRPPVYSGPNGIFLLGDKFPWNNTGDDVFLNVLGRLPNDGEQFTRLDAATQNLVTSTYRIGTGWDIVPVLSPAEAGFFNIGPVPEPGVGALALLGLALLRLRRP